MKEERLFILRMIDEGKINAEEGVKLLKAVGGERSFNRTEVEEKLSKVVKKVDTFARDMKVKIEDFAKDAEPKVKDASRFVLDKTSVAFDEISRSIKNAMDDTKEVTDEDEFDVVYEDITEEEEQ